MKKPIRSLMLLSAAVSGILVAVIVMNLARAGGLAGTGNPPPAATWFPEIVPVDPHPPEKFGPFLIDGYRWTPVPEPIQPQFRSDLPPRIVDDQCEVQKMSLFSDLAQIQLPKGFEISSAEGTMLGEEEVNVQLEFGGGMPKKGEPPTIDVGRAQFPPGYQSEVWPEAPGRKIEKRQYDDVYVVITYTYPDIIGIKMMDATGLYTGILSIGVSKGSIEQLLQSLLKPSGTPSLPDLCGQATPTTTPAATETATPLPTASGPEPTEPTALPSETPTAGASELVPLTPAPSSES